MSIVHVNGVRLHVEEVASVGPQRGTAVLVHGMTTDSMASWFLTLAHPLAQAGFRVLMHDLRGHGHSDRPAMGYSLDHFVADLTALVAEHWRVEGPMHLFGNSFGGTIAFAYAARNPGRIAGIVTIESAPPIPAWFDRMRKRLARAAETLADTDAILSSRPISLRGLQAASGLFTGTSLSVELSESVLPSSAELAAIDCPVLCLYGGASAVRELAPDTRRLLPHSCHVVVPDQGHRLLVGAAGRVRAEVLPWLTAAVH
jgi:pimeloyl-ACP methyl ester carboxylesterase